MTVSNFPNTWPSITLDFQNSSQLDPRITFTRATSGTGDVNGLVRSFPQNVSRLVENGLLLEEDRTNLTFPSIVPTTTTGTINVDGASLTANAGVAPDGTNTATLYDVPSGTGSNRIYNFTGGVVQEEAFTWYIKGVSTDAVFSIRFAGSWLLSPGGDFNYTFATDTLSGSFVDAQPGNVQREFIGNGWIKITATNTPNSTTPSAVYWQTREPNLVGEFLIWGLQREVGSCPTSYIPTTTATVTRAADVCQITGDDFNSWFNTSGGTFTFDVPDMPTAGEFSNTFIADIGNNSTVGAAASGYVLTYNFSPQAFVGDTRVNDASQGEITVAVTGQSLKGAYGYETNNFNGAANGTLGTLDTNGALPTLGTNRVVLGARFNGQGAVNTPLASWRYYPTRVSDDALEALTQ